MNRPDKGPHLAEFVRGGETLMVVRKKALLRTLAVRDLARRGVEIPAEEVEETTRDFRRQFSLHAASELRAWLEAEALSFGEFLEVMREFAAIRMLERELEGEVDARVPNHIKVNAVREWKPTSERA